MKRILCSPPQCFGLEASGLLGPEYSFITGPPHGVAILEYASLYCSLLKSQGSMLHAAVLAFGTHLAGGFMDDTWDLTDAHPKLLRSRLVFDEEEFLNAVQGLLPCIEDNGHIIAVSTSAMVPGTLGHKWPAPPEVTPLALDRYMVMAAGQNTLIGWLRKRPEVLQRRIKIHRIVHAMLGGVVSAHEVIDSIAQSLSMTDGYFDTGFLPPTSP